MSKLPFFIFFTIFFFFFLFFIFFLFLFFSSPFLFLSLFSSSPYPFAHLIPSPSSRLLPNSACAAATGVRPRLLLRGLAPPPPPTGLRHRRHIGGLRPRLLLPRARADTSRAPPAPPPPPRRPRAFSSSAAARPSSSHWPAPPPPELRPRHPRWPSPAPPPGGLALACTSRPLHEDKAVRWVGGAARSRAEPRFCGSASVDGLQRASFRGLLRWSRLPALRLGGLRLEPLAELLLEPSQTGPKV